jgi:protein-S-isoprenylcysteine O-methyltransferase Ste14
METILKMKPPRIAAGLLLVTMMLWHLSPQNTILHIQYTFLGSVCILSGFVLMMWAWVLFRKAKTAICPTEKCSMLVTGGAFKISRNPMYLGMLAMLAGSSFLMGAIPSLLAPCAFFLIMDKVFIPYEEDKLSRSFGREYSDYTGAVRRWV